MFWATLWAIFSQTDLVTLVLSQYQSILASVVFHTWAHQTYTYSGLAVYLCSFMKTGYINNQSISKQNFELVLAL
jgi:hypothetical protein